jgi:hypothetical protein
MSALHCQYTLRVSSMRSWGACAVWCIPLLCLEFGKTECACLESYRRQTDINMALVGLGNSQESILEETTWQQRTSNIPNTARRRV